MVEKGALGLVERGSVVERRRLGPEPLPHKRAEMELAEPLVEEQSLGEDRGWEPSPQEDDQEEVQSLEA